MINHAHKHSTKKNVRNIVLQPTLHVHSLHMHGRITIATRMHHDVGPLLIHTYPHVSGWSNTKGAASAHLSDSVAAVGTMQYGQYSILFTIFRINCCILF